MTSQIHCYKARTINIEYFLQIFAFFTVCNHAQFVHGNIYILLPLTTLACFGTMFFGTRAGAAVGPCPGFRCLTNSNKQSSSYFSIISLLLSFLFISLTNNTNNIYVYCYHMHIWLEEILGGQIFIINDLKWIRGVKWPVKWAIWGIFCIFPQKHPFCGAIYTPKDKSPNIIGDKFLSTLNLF